MKENTFIYKTVQGVKNITISLGLVAGAISLQYYLANTYDYIYNHTKIKYSGNVIQGINQNKIQERLTELFKKSCAELTYKDNNYNCIEEYCKDWKSYKQYTESGPEIEWECLEKGKQETLTFNPDDYRKGELEYSLLSLYYPVTITMEGRKFLYEFDKKSEAKEYLDLLETNRTLNKLPREPIIKPKAETRIIFGIGNYREISKFSLTKID